MLKRKAPQNPVMPSNQTSFLDYALFSGSLDDLFFEKKALINTINQYSYCIAEKDPEFKKALLGAEILLPDGVAITAAVRFLYGKSIRKIAGADLHQYLLAYLNQKAGRCFSCWSECRRQSIASLVQRQGTQRSRQFTCEAW